MNKKKILIIGAKGMLGSELTKVFSEDSVIAWDIDDLDITKKNDVLSKVANLSPDIVINSAAYNNVDGAENEVDRVNLLNGYAVGYLAEASKSINATFVHYSTDYIFNGEKKEGYREDNIPKPISIYGSSKLLGEEEVKKYIDKYYIIRLSRLFGKMGEGQNVKKGFVDIMIELAKDKQSIEVIDEELSSPTYAPDIAKLTRDVLRNNISYGTYHGSNSGSCTWHQFASEIFRLANKNIDVVSVPGIKLRRLARRPKYSILLNTKLLKQRSWQEALKEYLHN